jgi:hypothetical protein
MARIGLETNSSTVFLGFKDSRTCWEEDENMEGYRLSF